MLDGDWPISKEALSSTCLRLLAGTLIPSAVFRTVGLYDDRHFRQCGDTELTVRAAKAGHRLLVSYDLPVYSYSGEELNINTRRDYRLSDLREYFFDLRSHFNLRDRFSFASASLSSPFGLVRYLAFDFGRVAYHFLRRLRIR